MDFLKNKWTQIVAWVVLALDTVVLIIGGATLEELSNGLVLTSAIVAAVSALIAFIAERVKEK
ncbi:MAG: hypothetical protein MJZ25_13055 [Fibrobacter sp.]|nr:hypothetical protein [Fibrobacter sp.]